MYLLFKSRPERKVIMSKTYNLSKQEYEIMKILWTENRKMLLSEISSLLHSQGFCISTGTIKTYLQRLIKKGSLAANKVGHNLEYFPRLSETEYAQEWTQKFIEKEFDNSLGNFLLAFTGNHKLSEDEKQALKKLLDEE